MELWDAYDSDFKIIPGVTLVRGEEATFADGVYHLVCEIIVKHADGTYLIMQRHPRKAYGSMWEASAGGSALRGESPIDSAIRELREETGIAPDRMTEVGRVVNPPTHSVYAEFLAETSCDKNSVVLQEGETVAYRWIDRETLIAMKGDLLTHRMWQFVPELQGLPEKFYLEVPGIARREEALAYIKEFYEYGSDINGAGGLNHFPEDYEGWLRMTAVRNVMEPNERRVPAREYFLVRENDNRIVGMINIRIALNERMRKNGGHIGYSIRPTERGKGYNKINLYLGLKVCNRYGIDTVLMDADLENPASWRTMEAFGGVRVREYFDDENSHCTVVDYEINTKKALAEHPEYEAKVADFRLETERLILRPMSMQDFDALYTVFSDAENMKHYPFTFDEARVRGWIERNRERYRQYGFGLWAVCRKDTGEVIGDCGLTLQNIDGQMLPEIGYHIRADLQRKGYAKEAAAAVLDWAWSNTSYPALYSYCKYTNVASYKTAEAIGMRFDCEYPDEANGTTHVSVIRRKDVVEYKGEELLTEQAFSVYAACMYKPTFEAYKARMEQYLEDPAVRIFLYRAGGYIEGILVLDIRDSEAEILGIAVDQSCRGYGVGRKMITEAMNDAHITSLYAQTDDDAVEFYRRSGFAVSEEKREYPDGVVTRYHCRLKMS